MAEQYNVEGDVVASLVEARIKKAEDESVQESSAPVTGAQPDED